MTCRQSAKSESNWSMPKEPEQSDATVLVVDDDEMMRAFLESFLADRYRVATRENGREALDVVRGAEPPDLVILDLQIGNMGGVAACLDLRLESDVERLPRVPVLILLDRAADVFLARQADADGWLVKPLDPFRLRRAAELLLAGETMYEEPEPVEEVTAADTDEPEVA